MKQRKCPKCSCALTYKHNSNYYTAKRINSPCRKCSKRNRGKDNPFYGRKHSDETKIKISHAASERVYSEEFKEIARQNLAKVTNKRPLYDIWLEKYGKEIADKKLAEFKRKQSENNSGEKNSMFGKPAPQGSGNGWSGWYKGWYFRSLRELSYMINVLEAHGLSWKAPDKEYVVQYIDYAGKIRNYFPDFIVEDKWMVEVKPCKLHNTPKVLAKKEAAIKFCNSRGLEYQLIDPPILSSDEINKLYVEKKIKFIQRYEQKFKERLLKNG